MAKGDNAERRGLDDYGIIFLSGDMDQGSAQSVCERIIEINVSEHAEIIQLIISSSGGSCTAGFWAECDVR